MAQQVLTACKETNIKVINILNEISKKDDVTEFITTIQLIQVTINGLIKSKGDFPFDVLKDLQNSLTDYESLLAQLNTRPGGLLRFFASNRLRRKIEMANASLHAKLEKIRENIKQTEPVASERKASSTQLSSVSGSRESISIMRSKENLMVVPTGNNAGEDVEDENDANLKLSLMIEDKDGKDLWGHLFGLDV
jgi:hypothetical protein